MIISGFWVRATVNKWTASYYTHTHTRAHICVCMHVYMCAYTHINLYTYVCIYACVHTHTCVLFSDLIFFMFWSISTMLNFNHFKLRLWFKLIMEMALWVTDKEIMANFINWQKSFWSYDSKKCNVMFTVGRTNINLINKFN